MQNWCLAGYFCLPFKSLISSDIDFLTQHWSVSFYCCVLQLPPFPISQFMKVPSQGSFPALFFQLKHTLPATASRTPAHEPGSWGIRMLRISSDYSWYHLRSFLTLSELLTASLPNHRTGLFSHTLIWTGPQISALIKANQLAMPT